MCLVTLWRFIRPSLAYLHLLANSTGIKMLGEGGWKANLQGADWETLML